MTEEKKSLLALIILLIILCIHPSCTNINAQSLSSYNIAIDELHKVFPEVNLNISKPQTIYNKEVSVQKLMFLSGITVTTIGIIQIARNQSFDHKSVDKSIALDPHRLLIVSGLSMLTISITIPL